MKTPLCLLCFTLASFGQHTQQSSIPGTSTPPPPVNQDGLPARPVFSGLPASPVAPGLSANSTGQIPARASAAEVSSALASAQAQLERAHAVITAFLRNPPALEAAPQLQPDVTAPQVAPGGPPRFNHPIISPSGENLSAAAGANLAGRASGNLSGNASVSPDQMAQPPAPQPAGSPMATADGMTTTSAPRGITLTPETFTALNTVRQDVERLLPVLSALNSGNLNLAGALPPNAVGSVGTQATPTPTGRATGRPAPPGGLRIQPAPR